MFLILDAEATGLSQYDRIVSICWSLYKTDGTVAVGKHHVIYPDGLPLPAGATARARRHGLIINS
jgi:hypothetical protein